MNKVKIVGMGPGHKDYVLPVANKLINEATWLVGGKRHLEMFGQEHQRFLPITAKIPELLQEIKENYKNENIVVMVSGDPGLYSFTKVLLRVLNKEDLEVYPGISAVQYLFSKGVIAWEQAYMASFHGREEKDIDILVKDHPVVALFTDNVHTPNTIIEQLRQDEKLLHKKILIGERLSYEDEILTVTTVGEYVERDFQPLNVMVIYSE